MPLRKHIVSLYDVIPSPLTQTGQIRSMVSTHQPCCPRSQHRTFQGRDNLVFGLQRRQRSQSQPESPWLQLDCFAHLSTILRPQWSLRNSLTCPSIWKGYFWHAFSEGIDEEIHLLLLAGVSQLSEVIDKARHTAAHAQRNWPPEIDNTMHREMEYKLIMMTIIPGIILLTGSGSSMHLHVDQPWPS